MSEGIPVESGAGQVEPKRAAALRAVALVEDGMLLGLGTGTTATHFVRELAARVAAHRLQLRCVATSEAIAELAREMGLQVTDDVTGPIDLTVDGADEIDPHLNLIKGHGGALLREKIVASASTRMVVVATADKLVDRLGRGPLPVEVLPFLAGATARRLEQMGLIPHLRGGASDPYRTDNGNVVCDCELPRADQPLAELAAQVESIPGVMGHGLFLGIARLALVAQADGAVREIRPGI